MDFSCQKKWVNLQAHHLWSPWSPLVIILRAPFAVFCSCTVCSGTRFSLVSRSNATCLPVVHARERSGTSALQTCARVRKPVHARKVLGAVFFCFLPREKTNYHFLQRIENKINCHTLYNLRTSSFFQKLDACKAAPCSLLVGERAQVHMLLYTLLTLRCSLRFAVRCHAAVSLFWLTPIRSWRSRRAKWLVLRSDFVACTASVPRARIKNVADHERRVSRGLVTLLVARGLARWIALLHSLR